MLKVLGKISIYFRAVGYNAQFYMSPPQTEEHQISKKRLIV